MEPLRPADPRRVGAYRTLARLGSGGMGTVYLGRSAGGRTVAVKVVHAALAGDAEFRARFAREVTAARAVGGAFTAPVIDADPDAPSPWLVTTYLPGHSLRRVVEGGGPLPPGSVLTLGAGLAEALAGIHRAGVVHRDLKPSNVLLTPDGPRVIDFGVARAAEVSAVTRTGALLGSPGYLSPEQATGAESGPAGDVFSLGAVLTYAATGHGPFGDGAAHDLLYRVVHGPPWLAGIADPELRTLVAACLHKDPARRPDAGEVIERLAAVAPAAPYGVGWLPPAVAAEITRPVALPTVPPGAGRRAVVFGGVGVAAVAVLGGGAALLRDRANRPTDGAWTYTPPSAELSGGPYVSGGLVFVTEDFQSNGLVALDPRTGRPRWKAVDVQRPGAADPMRLIAAGRIVYTCGLKSFKAFDQATGSPLFSVPADLITTDPAPVLGGGLLFAGGTQEQTGLCAYDAATGQRRWAFNTGDPVQANPAAAGATVYVGTGAGTVFAVDAATGQARWRRTLDPSARLPPRIETSPLISGDVLYVVTDGNLLYALDAGDGSEKWTMTGLPSSGGSGSAVSVIGDTVYLADAHGGLAALGARDGRLRWRRRFSGKSFHAASQLPVTSGDTAFCFDDDTLYALDAGTGAVRWSSGGLDATYEFPVLAAGAVHFASLSAVVTLDPATGRVLRRRPAELADHLTAYRDVLYWRESQTVRAARANA